jgi:hypothetical protein
VKCEILIFSKRKKDKTWVAEGDGNADRKSNKQEALDYASQWSFLVAYSFKNTRLMLFLFKLLLVAACFVC